MTRRQARELAAWTAGLAVLLAAGIAFGWDDATWFLAALILIGLAAVLLLVLAEVVVRGYVTVATRLWPDEPFDGLPAGGWRDQDAEVWHG